MKKGDMIQAVGDICTWYGNVDGYGITDTLFLLLGSHGCRQGGASWPMENYFQAEAFNLDKVLDEFEQNEGELLCQRGDGDKLRVTALE